MESGRVSIHIETPGWLIEATPSCLSGQAAERFDTRQEVTRITLNRYRRVLGEVLPGLRPKEPTRDEALTLPKRKWESIFQKWRSSLRHLDEEHGLADTSLDALTFDLQMTLEIEALREM